MAVDGFPYWVADKGKARTFVSELQACYYIRPMGGQISRPGFENAIVRRA